MVKAYLRYEADFTFGVVSSNCNGIFDKTGSWFVTGVLEGVAVWNTRTGECICTLVDSNTEQKRLAEVKTLARSENASLVAAGCSDGSVRIWDLTQRQIRVSFYGHRRPVTRLAFSSSGELLASGSQDTGICLWDVIGEVGVCKLQGHSHEITGLSFLQDRQFLASCAKDGHLKLWQLSSQHCCQTLLHDKGVLWSLASNRDGTQIVVGSIDRELIVYALRQDREMPMMEVITKIPRREENRVRFLQFSPDGKYLTCANAAATVELFQIYEKSDAVKRLEKRQKEAEKVLKDLQRRETKEGQLDKNLAKKRRRNEKILLETPDDVQLYRSVALYESSSTVLSTDFCPGRTLEIGVTLSNNTFEVIRFKTKIDMVGMLESTRRLEIAQGGHRSGIRSLCLSSDDKFLLSTSEREAKVWNGETGVCIHTLPCKYGLTGIFAPGDSIVVVGTKSGTLELFDLQSAQKISSVVAYEGPVWSMTSLVDRSGFVSAGSGGSCIVWNWAVEKVEEEDVAKRATIHKSTRLLKMESDILSVKISACGTYIALALLDATIRVFYAETFSEYLTLYGHKLPVLSVDISNDNQLIVSGSADKNIRIWGLDYGDCHKSLFAHRDSVTQVSFVHTTHYVMSVGKDGMLKYWDADKFELLLELSGHQAEIWCLSASRQGDYLFTGSNDRSIRRWVRTDEPFFLEEEKDKRLEALFDDEIAEDAKGPLQNVAGRQSLSTLTAADSIVEALELTALEAKRSASEGPNPLLLGLDPSAYVLKTVQNVKSSDMEIALLSLSFSDAMQLLSYLLQWLKQSCTQTETICRIICHLVRLHHRQFSTSIQARTLFLELQTALRPALDHLKDTVGFNLEGVRFIRSLVDVEGMSAKHRQPSS